MRAREIVGPRPAARSHLGDLTTYPVVPTRNDWFEQFASRQIARVRSFTRRSVARVDRVRRLTAEEGRDTAMVVRGLRQPGSAIFHEWRFAEEADDAECE